MRILLFITTSLIFNAAFAQKDTTQYYFKEVGMRIGIPVKFETVDAAEDERLRMKGEKAIEDANDVEVNTSSTKNLLSIKHGPHNYLNITVTPYRQVAKNGWEEDNKVVKNLVYNSFVEKVSPKNIDTSGTTVQVNGILFDRFQMTIKITPAMTMKMLLYSKYYKGYDFGICYVFVDDAIGMEFERMINNSTFEK